MITDVAVQREQSVSGTGTPAIFPSDAGRRSERQVSALEAALEYFDVDDDVRAKRGLVETPPALVDFIVRTAFESFLAGASRQATPDPRDIKWLDPAVGAGAFALGILRHHEKQVGGFASVGDLPRMELIDVSPEAIQATTSSVRHFVEARGLTLEAYSESGRLVITAGDFLTGDSAILDDDRRESAEIVVGNPPYVRARMLDTDYRARIRSLYPRVFQPTADLYSYFLAEGISRLSQGGVLAYVTPASYTRSANGRLLRKFLQEASSVIGFYDLDENRVFPGVSMHVAVTVLGRGWPQRAAKYAHCFDMVAVEGLFNGTRRPGVRFMSNNSLGGWVFEETLRTSLGTNKQNFASLGSFGIGPFSGVRSGAAAAFLRTKQDLEVLPADIRDAWFRPIAIARDIRRWSQVEHSRSLLWAPRGSAEPPKEILDLLRPFEHALRRRSEVRNGVEWYQLRSCSYYEQMRAEVIAYPDIARVPRFGILPRGTLLSDGAFFLNSSDPALLGILQSEAAHEYFRRNCGTVGSAAGKGRLRMKVAAVRAFPLPADFRTSAEAQAIRDLSYRLLSGGMDDSVLSEMNERVSRMYRGIA